MTTQQPESLRLAEILEGGYSLAWLYERGGYGVSAELRRQHARITELESQLEAIGAGGVSGPLIGQPQAMPDLSQLTERGAKAWAGVDAQGLREGFTAADMATAAAQGFRDGVASLAASAWEPVAWLYESPMPDGSVFTGASAERLQVGVGTPPSTIEKPLYLAAPPTAQAEGWRDIATAPKDGTEILGYTEEVGALVLYWDSMTGEMDHWSDGMSVSYWKPTQWMPLPPAPGPAHGERHALC